MRGKSKGTQNNRGKSTISNIIQFGPHAVPSATHVAVLSEPFTLRNGDTLDKVQIAYETWGRLATHKDNVILVFTGLSPSAHAASCAADPSPGWWEYMIGPGKPIDTNHYYVICVNSLGSCFGSTGPASKNPKTDVRYGLNFPDLSIEDIANAGRLALRELGIERLYAVIGASLGGMSALAYAIQHGEEVENLLVLSTASHATPFAIAFRSLQRELIRSDPTWNNGDYAFSNPPVNGMRLARKAGLMTYRSPEEWRRRFGREKVSKNRRRPQEFGIEFEIESYLEHNAAKFVRNFDPNCYLYLSRAMDWFDVAEHGGSLEEGLAKIKAKRTLVVGVETDFLFPPWQQREITDVLHKAGKYARLSILPSIHGHDAFLVDEEHFAPVVRSFLS